MTKSVHSPITTFGLIEFNHVRDMRGKEAAKVRVIEDGEPQGFLWMSAEDLHANIRDFGASDGLHRALQAYGEKV